MSLIWRRGDELRLLFWVAALAASGSVAVAAAEAATFDRRQLIIPLAFIALAIGLHAFLAARGIRAISSCSRSRAP